MPYVHRENGIVIGLYANQQLFAPDFLENDSPDVVAFLNPPTPPVKSVSARQFKLQLLSSGLLDQVEAWIGSQPKAVQIAFEYSGSFLRDEPMMQSGFAAMGFTEEQIDDFYVAASTL